MFELNNLQLQLQYLKVLFIDALANQEPDIDELRESANRYTALKNVEVFIHAECLLDKFELQYFFPRPTAGSLFFSRYNQ